MAPWELFSEGGYFNNTTPSGFKMIQAFARKQHHQVWLNPDPQRFWDHPTVSAIRSEIPMFPLTVDGLRKAMRKLRT
jgi:hypothetical protein